MKQKSPEEHLAEVLASTNVRMGVLGQIRKVGNNWEVLAKCHECGNEVWVGKHSLLRGQKSCGCLGHNSRNRKKTPKATVTVPKTVAFLVANHLCERWQDPWSLTPREFESLKAQTTEMYHALRGETKL